MHIWTTLHQVDRDYIATFVDDFTLLATRRVDWSFLVATITFWGPIHAIFSIQGIEFTPTIEEYQILISRIAVTRVLATWRTAIVEHPYFPKHSTRDEQDFRTTKEYILRFYCWVLPAHEDPVEVDAPSQTSFSSTATMVELASTMMERDHLCQEVAKKDKGPRVGSSERLHGEV
ncbi:hypothetical protein CRG98_038328 [Punica granatum]|uniref:Aminotransferase-like plant mobile domain-containing protein n=1 Tax=Punica granatum TaxID=22663 RepID=A0A2I0IBB2_PUNGR|nr:hypothetical protein CRG98_038328 [Punica granatum]